MMEVEIFNSQEAFEIKLQWIWSFLNHVMFAEISVLSCVAFEVRSRVAEAPILNFIFQASRKITILHQETLFHLRRAFGS